jgi:hypothetical protein
MQAERSYRLPLQLQFNKFRDIAARLDASVDLVKSRCSAEEFDVYRMAVGKVMADIFVEVMNPLYRQHPDLKPAGLD